MKSRETLGIVHKLSLPPWGGSGLKYIKIPFIAGVALSPSLGREWIEIRPMIKALFYRRASPSLGREWIEMENVRETTLDSR